VGRRRELNDQVLRRTNGQAGENNQQDHDQSDPGQVVTKKLIFAAKKGRMVKMLDETTHLMVIYIRY
jgi:hypothetical protein